MDEPVGMDDVEKIYFDTDPDSLMTHRWTLQKPTKSKSYDSKEQKELILATKDLTDGYTIEVIKNGSSLKKYWLKEATYTCHLPIQCDVLVRFPKFQTEHVSRFSRLNHPET
ncbi:uncharacterized protein LOC131939042 [Physella acuta]|uniref:uncharacterized protein LOC131939042 n=1 Tax=Physella acuta TaxID=109671 RepID=UPI0027DB6723|nr:uncharacterized protein LOC131939042 [Physella acuta]